LSLSLLHGAFAVAHLNWDICGRGYDVVEYSSRIYLEGLRKTKKRHDISHPFDDSMEMETLGEHVNFI
jgi:hypothetical protein